MKLAKVAGPSLSAALLVWSVSGCSQSNDGGAGGAPGSGGASGGASAKGGTSATAGSASGGAATTGGAPGSGGERASGGAFMSGGASSNSGGTSNVGSGGAVTSEGGKTNGGASGGMASGGSAGASANGGMTSAGGTAGGGANTDAPTLVPDPSWTCGMPDGIPPPSAGKLVFSVSLTVSATHDVGNTQFGKRRQLDISGGTISGDKLNGTVMTGGLDYELTLSTGAMELEEVLILKTSDTTIFARMCGVAAPGDSVVRIVPDLEAPTSGSAAWLNTAKLVGTRTVDAGGGKITLDIYDVAQAGAASKKVELKDPPGVPNVSWDCVTATGTKGAEVLTENVTLGSSFSISNAKRGSRNVIPITGGTTTGKVVGKILNGGADYQLAGQSGTTLDARYTLAPNDGSFIIVRNCGPGNGLTPVFEAATDGPYAFLTTGKFLSSAPGAGSGGVSITFSERK